MPGQQVGIGQIESHHGDAVTGIEAEVRGPSEWLDPEDELYAEIVASDLLLAYSPENEPVVSFVATLDEGGRTVRNATGFALFRDEAGDIIGAGHADLDAPVAPNQPVRQTLYVYGKQPTGLATAEVYVFPSGV